MPKPIDVALWYANTMGWAVVPVHSLDAIGECTCGSIPCGSKAKHPRNQHGTADASSDRAQIRDWWREWPDANVGIVTGKINNIVVIDVDNRNGGNASLKKLEQDEQISRALVSRTGGGGRHIFCEYPEEDVELNFKIARGIDTKSDGGFVIEYPSVHASGKTYRWEVAPTANTTLEPLPSWAIKSSRRTRKDARSDFKPGEPIPEGQRNVELTKLAGKLRRSGLDEWTIASTLMAYQREHADSPLDEREVRRIAHSIARYDSPTEKVEKEIARQADPDGPLPYTHLGNAKRLLRLHGEDLRRVDGLGWVVWNGTHWEPDSLQRVRLRAYDVSTAIRDEVIAEGLEEKEMHAALRKADEVENERGTSGMLRQAEALSEFASRMSLFDADTMLFNVQNGTIDLTTGKLRAHAREDHITKLAPVTYDRRAKAPRFLQFLAETFGADKELVAYIQRLLGYFLTGKVNEQIFPIFWGKGGNGKGTLIEEVMESIMGSDYMAQAPASLLKAKGFSAHPTENMVLRGSRLVVASESSARLDEEVIKRLTGGDMISARLMRENFVNFKPTHKLLLLTNVKPHTSASDAIWRRLQLVPFNFTPKIVNKQLDAELRDEASGILNWLVQGCLIWQRDGLNPPPIVVATTQEHRESEDVLGMFIGERLEFGRKFRMSIAALYAEYEAWCLLNGVRAYSKIRFGKELQERRSDVKKYVSNGLGRWRGVKVRPFSKESSLKQ